jgi:cytidine deaminase
MGPVLHLTNRWRWIKNDGSGFLGGNMESVQKKEGLICICAECKSVIRTIGDTEENVQPLLSHGICAACANRLYGDLFRPKS